MLRPPLIATAVVAAALALLLPVISGAHVLVAVVSAIALIVGAWCAPTSFSSGQTGSALLMGWEVWTVRSTRLKSLPLYVAGAATLGLVLLNVFDPGVAVVVGIALALGTGAAGMAVALGMSLISGETKDKAAPESTEDALAS